MDVALTILAGLGLRLFLVTATDEGPSSKLTTALLGLWEGVIVHQLSGRSSSSHLDHFLAYGLRLTVDLLISRNFQRMVMVVLWSALGTLTSEAIAPYAGLRSALKKERERARERRYRHARSVPASVPIIATSLPPRIRAYKQPEGNPPQTSSTPPLLPPQPPPQSSTPLFPYDRPPSPPSFFLQETSDIYSPSPKPVQIQAIQPEESSPRGALPVRPRSGLASIFDHSPDSGSPLPVPMHLPTPPESAQSAVPSDGLIDGPSNGAYDDIPKPPRFEHQLYTIPELSSPEDNSTPGTVHPQTKDIVERVQQDASAAFQSTATTSVPLPIPNAGMRQPPSSKISRWLSSQSMKANAESIFTNPFSPSMSPAAPIPVPLPVRMRHQDPLWEMRTPTGNDNGLGLEDEDHRIQEDENNGNINLDDSDSDELRTPGIRDVLHMETDNEHDADPLRTPRHLRVGEEDVLSPLGLEMRSGLDENSDFSANPGSSRTDLEPAPDNAEDNEELAVPGSLSQNILLRPPLPPSGPLFRRPTPPPESPPAPSPSTIHSGMSDISTLSTRVPGKLYIRAGELRQKAREEEKIRAQLEDERRLAEMEGRTMDALLLKIRVRDMDAEAQKLHEKAARRYYASRNTLEITNKIDVHGLRPREAFDRIERAIVKANKEGKSVVRVIVGKGLHSVNQQPTLKPTVQRELQRLKIPCEVDPRNPGVLNVTLPSTSTSS